MYNYGYNNWYWGCCDNSPKGTVDNGNCHAGSYGSKFTTYGNNELYGSCRRPVQFNKLEKRCINGKDINVLVADRKFYDRLKFDCVRARDFYATINVCLEFGDTRPLFLAEKKYGECECEKLYPLETAYQGFILATDQVQAFSDGRKLLKLTAVFDPCNEHVTISTYHRKHVKCDCYYEDDKCGCDHDHDHHDFDGIPDGPII